MGGTQQQVVAPNVSLPLSSDPSAVNVVASQATPTSVTSNVVAGAAGTQQQSAGPAQTAANIQQQLFNLGESVQGSGGLMNDAGNRIANLQLPGGLQPVQVTATPVQGTKEWHQGVTPDLRNHLVHKL